MDLPTFLEANYITSFAAKAAWVLVYIVVYGLRPVLIRPKPIGEASFPSGPILLTYTHPRDVYRMQAHCMCTDLHCKHGITQSVSCLDSGALESAGMRTGCE